jgi:hypothetical protein
MEDDPETARDHGVADRLRTIPGNIHSVELPASQFHLVIIANVAHLLTPEDNVALLKRTRAALQPDGRVAVIDVFPGQPEGDLNRTLYALGLALRTAHGRAYSCGEFETILQEAGYREPQYLPLRVPPYALGLFLTTVH